MPFWWRRRGKFWGGRWRRRRQWRTKRRRPRLYKRRRTFRTNRRRKRRRRRKVRRKKRQTIPVRQWQPDRVVKCKIKGVDVLVLGAQGKQLMCYTNEKKNNTPPKAPGGGGFGCQQYSLGSLYQEYLFKNNIWTHTNIFLDLVRYLGVKFTVYRHADTDFIINYDRQPPFDIGKFTYMLCHPQNMLLSKHKKILLSKFTKPHGRVKKTFFVKPPKQMITKWFFSEHFSHAPLVLLKAAAFNSTYAHLGCCNVSQLLTIFYINPDFYQFPNWGLENLSTSPYKPYQNVPQLYFKDSKGKIHKGPEAHQTYADSISYDKGWFQTAVLAAVAVYNNQEGTSLFATMPCNVTRYNPNLDSGVNSKLYLKSVTTSNYLPPTTDSQVIIQGYPLWMMIYGFLNYIAMVKKDKTFLETHFVVLQSPALLPYSQPGAGKYYVPIDKNFVNGKAPFDEYITVNMKAKWYPTVQNQIETLNAIVCSGPYIPKYDNTKASTWELHMFYQFFFKLGGPEITDKPVTDPTAQGHYEVPDTVQGTIQISNPAKQKAETIFHSWDYRRGCITKTAIERMQCNLSIDTDFEPTSPPAKKRKTTGPELTCREEENQEILSCLQTLCEEDTCQEFQETQTIQDLIKQQQQQQHKLKRTILKLLMEIKDKQRMLQLQTGVLD
nr:MAG: ORF1 [Torque teno midi virus]